ncbi:MAG: sulfite exporter TauE/SafE family protein [Cyanobacteriota bacterium]|nr:sulfite exporter TauE/SafE family protein [Cyanobacteriota bacterium]
MLPFALTALNPAQALVISFAVLVYGFGKGGAASPLSAICVPLMSLVMSPFQAAAILLPLLLVLDGLALLTFRGCFDRHQLRLLLPPALLGMVVASLVGRWLSDDGLRLLIGVLCLGFVLLRLGRRPSPGAAAAAGAGDVAGRLWGAVAGFTGMLVHASGPPVMVHLMGQRLEPRVLAGTQAWLFAVLNASKVIPFVSSGQLDGSALRISLLFLPVTPIGIVLGQRFLRSTTKDGVYAVLTGAMLLSGVMLLWQGWHGPVRPG